MDDVLPLVDMNIDTFEAQIDLSEKILKEYYSKYPETPVVCHLQMIYIWLQNQTSKTTVKRWTNS